MRFATKLATIAAALTIASASAARNAPAAPAPAAAVLSTVTAPSFSPAMYAAVLVQDAKVEIDVNDNQGGAWYTQPVWIAIGIVALVLIILLIVAAGRRDSTTVVK